LLKSKHFSDVKDIKSAKKKNFDTLLPRILKTVLMAEALGTLQRAGGRLL
jgi:hypothetical protein